MISDLMKKRDKNPKLIYAAVFAVLALGIIFVATNPQLPSFNGVTDYNSLVEKLTDMGIQVETSGEVTAPFFSVPGKEISINGNKVEIFEHSDTASAEAKAKLVSEDGLFVGTQVSDGLELSTVQWGGTPNFYKRGRLIVIYVGDDKKTKDILTGALGTQFAGGN